MRHLLTLKDWSREDMVSVLDLADTIKAEPHRFKDHCSRRVLVMMFEKPSLRTRVSFETGMAQMGGHAIYYDLTTSPLGAGKETVEDTAKVLGRYADLLMARLFEHSDLEKLAALSGVPVINALTNFSHPCQILADLQTVRDHKHRLEGLTLAYLGDANNNVTHSLLFGCAKTGVHIQVGCPDDPTFIPVPDVLEAARSEGRSRVEVVHDAAEAVRNADIVYTDSWMSYHIPKEELEVRVEALRPFQVNAELMAKANPDAIFMNCLPAIRGYEQTAEVIDGPQSVVFDEAENRLHAQKAVILRLLGLA